MTANKDLKKRIRERQAKTGESYTTARAHILRARGTPNESESSSNKRINAIVLKCNSQSMRVQVPKEDSSITLRFRDEPGSHIAPGQFVDATLDKEWEWRGDRYATGTVSRGWTDISALGLVPLPLEDSGILDLSEMHDPFVKPDPYADMWEFFASTPRSAFEFDGIAWGKGVGVDPEDPEACLVADAAELAENDVNSARELLMEALLADLRCIDAHVHLGNIVFDSRPQDALTHYEIAAGIGELSLNREFNGMLPWSFIYNRPFLRALHGQGLCLWRLGQNKKARKVFERTLSLNPADNQGIRFCWDDIRNDRPWTPEGVGDAYGSGTATTQ